MVSTQNFKIFKKKAGFTKLINWLELSKPEEQEDKYHSEFCLYNTANYIHKELQN